MSTSESPDRPETSPREAAATSRDGAAATPEADAATSQRDGTARRGSDDAAAAEPDGATPPEPSSAAPDAADGARSGQGTPPPPQGATDAPDAAEGAPGVPAPAQAAEEAPAAGQAGSVGGDGGDVAETDAAGDVAAEEGDVAARGGAGNAVAAPLLSADALHITFPGRRGADPARAVDGVDLDIRQGEIVALVGESGCGKTTLARSLLGLVPPTSGRVTFGGQPLDYASRALKAYRKRVQLVLQDPSGSLNPRHTVYDAVAEGLRIHRYGGDEQAAVARALARAGLRPPERFFLRYPHELSGGQRQRVVIAGALVLEPELIVADEPVASLDASVRGEILALLLRLRDELGLAALVVTHDLGLAWNIADRVAVMYLGRIVETGTVERVLTAPQHPYTQALLSVLPEAEGPEVVLTGEPPDPSRIPGGCRFHARCHILAGGEAERAGVADACRTEDLPVLDGGGTAQVACHWAQQQTHARTKTLRGA